MVGAGPSCVGGMLVSVGVSDTRTVGVALIVLGEGVPSGGANELQALISASASAIDTSNQIFRMGTPHHHKRATVILTPASPAKFPT